MPKKPQDHLPPKSEMDEKSDVVYAVEGKERDKLGKLRDAAIAAQNSFFGVVQFIAAREDVNLPDVTFDQMSLTFSKSPKSE